MDVKNHAVPRVLIVDDEPLIRWSVSETLADHGCEVVETGDARGARLAIGDDAPFDVVLLDYRLPDSDDLSLLASIRRATPTAQVILMTAFSRPEMVRGALELGAYRVISKPFEMEAIADLVAQAHARARTAQQAAVNHPEGTMTPTTTETTAQVIAYAIEGRLTKHALATLLVPESRRGFLDACATIETSYTDACAAAKDPCLESGCSCEGAICLQPLLRAGAEYQRACGAAWATLFADGRHRDPAWRHTLSEYELG